MAESESKSQFAALLGPAMIVAAMSFVGYVTYEPSLQSARQQLGGDKTVPPPPTPAGFEALHARLWDDPLVVAHQHNMKRKVANKPADLEDIQRDINEFLEYFTKSDAGSWAAGRVLVMPVFIPGEPFGDDAETRMRATYAVLSALNVARYEIKYPDRLAYVEVPICVFDEPTNSQICFDLTTPIKLFTPKERHERTDARGAHPAYAAVIACWINESQLGSRPLAALRQVLQGLIGDENLQRHRDRVDLRVIGPRSSDTLLQMAEEDELIGQPNHGPAESLRAGQFARDFSNAQLLSATATACREDFKNREDVNKKESAFAIGGHSKSGLTIVRTIGTDNELATAIGHELALRGAMPLGKEDRKYIVLVTESDTHYGRSITRAFRRKFPNITGAGVDRNENRLQVFNYLQGIDGKLNDARKDEADANSSKNSPTPADSRPAAAAPADIQPASGRSQYDYLRRLEDHLLDFHLEKKKLGHDGITAIGVVGTDVYDKLLVLRALRKKFPRAWFFTTDVDAELARTNEYPTTRNLLIASHFGLELNRNLQRQAPPFRDSYQTATFLACLHGLREERLHSIADFANEHNIWHEECCPNNRPLEPLVFELGRTGPFQLTTTLDRPTLSAEVHPHSPREVTWFGPRQAFFLSVIVVGVLALLAIHSSRVRDILGHGLSGRFFVIAASVSAFVCLSAALIQWCNQQPDGEPFAIFEGISLWVPILLRFGAAAVGLVMLLSAVQHVELEPTVDGIVESLLPGPRVGPPAPPAAPQSLAQDVGLLFATCYQWARDVRQCLVRKEDWQRALSVWPSGLGNTTTVTQTISNYWDQGQRARRTVRAGVIGIAIFLFSAALFALTDEPLLPFRGNVSEFLSVMTIWAASIIMFALTAFVLDALRLSRKLLRQLGRVAPDWPVNKRLHDPRRHVLTVRFIARRTQAVGKLTWYPLTVLLIMILARSKSFDLIDFSWPLLVLWASLGALVVLTTWEFRKAANDSREAILNRLRDEMYGLNDTAVRGIPKELYKQAIEEIENESAGAFRPFTQDPLFTSLFLFFGGSGGILIFDQLVPYL